jgi:hypothetical protein
LRLTFFKLHGLTRCGKSGAAGELSHDRNKFLAVASPGDALY